MYLMIKTLFCWTAELLSTAHFSCKIWGNSAFFLLFSPALICFFYYYEKDLYCIMIGFYIFYYAKV